MERRKAILDAAEALLAEQGYEAATLKAAGERAGIPIASMYHYFADRYQVDAELLQRHLGELDRLIGATLAEPRAQTLREAVDVMIDLLLDYLRRHRSCTELWFAGRHTTLDEMVRAFDEAQAERLWRHLVEQRLVPADTPCSSCCSPSRWAPGCSTSRSGARLLATMPSSTRRAASSPRTWRRTFPKGRGDDIAYGRPVLAESGDRFGVPVVGRRGVVGGRAGHRHDLRLDELAGRCAPTRRGSWVAPFSRRPRAAISAARAA